MPRDVTFRQVLLVVELLLQLSDLRDVLAQVPQDAHQGAGQDIQADTSFYHNSQYLLAAYII